MVLQEIKFQEKVTTQIPPFFVVVLGEGGEVWPTQYLSYKDGDPSEHEQLDNYGEGFGK